MPNMTKYANVETEEVDLGNEVELPEAKLVDEALDVSFQVVAPSDLEPGFEFAVTFEQVTYLATVPESGASMGCLFTPINIRESHTRRFPQAGAWTKDLWACADHPMFVPALIFGIIVRFHLLATVANRLQGLRGSDAFLGVLLFLLIVSYVGMTESEGNERGRYGHDTDTTFTIVFYCAFATFLTLTYLVRTQLRRRLAIRGNGAEDCLLSWFCNCCVIFQMHSQVKNMTTSGTPVIGRMKDRLVQPVKPKRENQSCVEATIV